MTAVGTRSVSLSLFLLFPLSGVAHGQSLSLPLFPFIRGGTRSVSLSLIPFIRGGTRSVSLSLIPFIRGGTRSVSLSLIPFIRGGTRSVSLSLIPFIRGGTRSVSLSLIPFIRGGTRSVSLSSSFPFIRGGTRSVSLSSSFSLYQGCGAACIFFTASSAILLHPPLSPVFFFQSSSSPAFFTSILVLRQSSHLSLGLPRLLLPCSRNSAALFGSLSSAILSTCPALCSLLLTSLSVKLLCTHVSSLNSTILRLSALVTLAIFRTQLFSHTCSLCCCSSSVGAKVSVAYRHAGVTCLHVTVGWSSTISTHCDPFHILQITPLLIIHFVMFAFLCKRFILSK